MMKFLEKFCPCKKEEEPSTLAKIGKGVLIGVGVVAGVAAVFTAVEVILVKFFKKCITVTVQCTDLSAYDEDEDDDTLEEADDEDVDDASEEIAAE